jgi:hypothetical protein
MDVWDKFIELNIKLDSMDQNSEEVWIFTINIAESKCGPFTMINEIRKLGYNVREVEKLEETFILQFKKETVQPYYYMIVKKDGLVVKIKILSTISI